MSTTVRRWTVTRHDPPGTMSRPPVAESIPPEFTLAGGLIVETGMPSVKGWQVTAIGPDDAVLVVLTNPEHGQP